MSDQVFQQLLNKIANSQAEIKEFKRLIRELENDLPMELEDLMLSLKDMKKQAKEGKDDHLKNLTENNADYMEYRERVQNAKEELAQSMLELYTLAANTEREHGPIDKKITVQGEEMRLQTQKDVQLFLNGKQVK